MLLPVIFYKYSYLWANGLMLVNIYTKSPYFHRFNVEYLFSYLKTKNNTQILTVLLFYT